MGGSQSAGVGGEDLGPVVGSRDLPKLREVLATGRPSRDDLGRALTEAADSGWVPGIRALLDAGADPNWHPTGAPRGFPLAQAVHRLHLPAVLALLDGGADIEARDYQGRTPLHQAVSVEADLATETPPNADLTAALVRRGADVLARTPSGETAADLAHAPRHPAAERLLRRSARQTDEPGGRP